jgi:hypothetical protein
MPAVTQQHQETPSGKKRRRDDHDYVNAQHHPSTPTYEGFFRFKQAPPPLGFAPTFQGLADQQPHHNVFAYTAPLQRSPGRKHIFPLPATKRLRESHPDHYHHLPHSRSTSPTSHTQAPPRQLQETSPNPTRLTTAPARQPSTTTSSAALLSRCHICHRKPTRKADLDSFADCELCHQRTCFICLRECLDWRTEDQRRWGGYGSASFSMRDADQEDGGAGTGLERPGEEGGGADGKQGVWSTGGHRTKICSGCCVERGQDGDVVCYGCLPFVDG